MSAQPRLDDALELMRQLGDMLKRAPAEGLVLDQAFCAEIGVAFGDLCDEIGRFGEALDLARADLVSVRELATNLLKENARLLRDARAAGRPGSGGAIPPFRPRTVFPEHIDAQGKGTWLDKRKKEVEPEDLSPCDVSSDGAA